MSSRLNEIINFYFFFILIKSFKNFNTFIFFMEQEVKKEEFMKAKEVKEMLGISYGTLYKWVKKGFLRAIRLPSGRLKFLKSDVEKLRAELEKQIIKL